MSKTIEMNISKESNERGSIKEILDKKLSNAGKRGNSKR